MISNHVSVRVAVEKSADVPGWSRDEVRVLPRRESLFQRTRSFHHDPTVPMGLLSLLRPLLKQSMKPNSTWFNVESTCLKT